MKQNLKIQLKLLLSDTILTTIFILYFVGFSQTRAIAFEANSETTQQQNHSNTINSSRTNPVRENKPEIVKSINSYQVPSLENGHILQRPRRQSSTEKHFGPKLIHQLQSVSVPPNKPHAVECPIESNPTAEVKWFKDDQLLMSQPTHLEQTGAELMFFQMNDEDSGQYHCEATNYLGSISSEPFKLTVQSSVQDPRVRLEPRLAESGVDQPVEFTCSFQTTSNRAAAATLRQQQRRPDVVWKRNGRKLPVKWLTSDQDLNGQETAGSEVRTRYVARHVTNSNFFSADATIFTLTIMKTQLKDDNATFSCLVGASLIDGESANKEELARESNQIKLRVYSSQDEQQLTERERIPFTISANIAPPIENVHQTSEPTKLGDLPPDQRKFSTTSLNQNSNSDLAPPTTVKMRTLKETLLDLYEISKPTLLGFAVLLLISIIILLQWVYMKRKNRLENRYIKHHTYSNSSGSGGSGVSSAINAIDCADSNLENFMNRTISAQSAMSLCGNNGLNNGGGKKYRSYRDQLRKVAAVNDNSTDLVLGNDLVNVNGYLLAASQTQNNQINNNNSHNNQIANDNEPFFISSELPNLYNQSLAAREQARSLLQASEHMRSLGNLQVAGQKQPHKFHHQVASALQRFNGANQNGSHLNLPLSFVFKDDSETSQNGSTTINNIRSNEQHHLNNRPSEGPSQMIASALWQPQINQQQFLQQQQQQFNHNQTNGQQMSENYQLINCNSVSPCSTSSSSSDAKNSQGNIMATKQTIDLNQVRLHKQGELNYGHVKESNTSLNHYSTIEMNDDDDSRYEEVEGCNQNFVANKRSSVHLKPSNPRNQDSFRVSKSSNFVRDNSIAENQLDQCNQKSLRSSLISNSNSSTSGCGDLNTTSSTMSNATDVNPTNKFNPRRVERQQHNLETKKTTGNLHQADKTNKLKYKDQLSPYAVSSICSSFTANQPPPVNSEAMRALSEQFDINHLLLGESSDRNSSTPPFDVLPPPPPPPPSSQAGQ